MLLAQLVDFHFKQHIYGEREAQRGSDREKEKGVRRTVEKGEKLKFQEEKSEKEDERREEKRREDMWGEVSQATREQWEMNIKQL